MVKNYPRNNLLDRIINVSYLDDYKSEPERVRLRMLNIISLISCMFTWTYAVLHVFLGKFYPSAITFSLGATYLFIIYLNHHRHTLISKVLHTINSNIGIYSFSCFLGLDSGVHLYILLSPLFVLSLFALTDVKWIVICIGIYVVNYWIMMYAPNPPIFEKMNIPHHLVIVFYHINIFFTLIMLTAIMSFVLYLNSNYIKEILSQNDVLVENEKKLLEEITKRKESEKNLQKLFDELSHSYKNLEQFSYVVSHNIRAPLSNIIGFANFYERNEKGLKSNHDIVDAIEVSAKSLDDILTDLNTILKSKNNGLDLKEEISMSEIVDSIARSLKQEIEHNDVMIKLVGDEEQKITTSRAILKSIMFNLLSNSIKYRQAHVRPEITVSLYKSGDNYTITVQDNGVGIDLTRYSDRIFKLYNRFNNNVQGKGIGLYLVKSHVESLGGTIDIESTPGVGTTFNICI